MSFATPIALAAAALAVPIVILYILKIRRRRVPVSTTIFWRQIFDEKQPRSLWQQLRHWLSLLVQLVLLALLVGALADPYFSWEIFQARRLVLVVDNSASMSATDASPTRIGAAKKIGMRTISAMRLRDEMALVVAGTEPQVVCGMTDHQRTLRDKLNEIPSTHGPTRVREAVVLARRLLGDHPHGQIIVLTDGCFADSTGWSRAGDVEMHFVGARTANAGISRWQVRRSLFDPLGYEILAEVINASDAPVECRLEVDLNDLPVDVIPLQIPAGGTWSQTLEKTSAEGGKLVARLNHTDALAADNTAWAILPKRQRQRVVLVTEGNHFLEKAITANPLVDLTKTTEVPTSFDPRTIYFFHRQTPARLPAAPTFVIDPTSDCDFWKIGDKLANPVVTKQDQDSVLLRHVKLENVLMPDARQLQWQTQPEFPMQTLVQALSGDPLVAAVERPQGKVLVLTVNLDEGDLTFRTAFPILVTNALAWFAGQTGEIRESLSSGAVTVLELPASSDGSASEWKLRSPLELERRLPPNVMRTTIGPLDHCGIWTVVRSSAARPGEPSAGETSVVEFELACNLANREESDLRTTLAPTMQVAQSSLVGALLTRPIWTYLLVIGWFLLTIEWWLYQRRWLG